MYASHVLDASIDIVYPRSWNTESSTLEKRYPRGRPSGNYHMKYGNCRRHRNFWPINPQRSSGSTQNHTKAPGLPSTTVYLTYLYNTSVPFVGKISRTYLLSSHEPQNPQSHVQKNARFLSIMPALRKAVVYVVMIYPSNRSVHPGRPPRFPSPRP